MPKPRRKPLKVGMPESRVLKGVIEACAFWDVKVDRQNTGGAYNSQGRYVAYGVAGNSDLTGRTKASWGPLAGRVVNIECKREHYDPRRVYGKGRERWLKQLAVLRETNADGGYGFWTDDPQHAFEVLRLLREGYRVEIGDDEHVYLIKPSKGE